MDQQHWRRHAKCGDLPLAEADRLFFVDVGRRSTEAKTYCSTCPVRRECLTFAITYNEVGIWAGFTVKERKSLRNSVGVPNVVIGIEYRQVGDRRQDTSPVVAVLVPPQPVRSLDEIQDDLIKVAEFAEELLAAL